MSAYVGRFAPSPTGPLHAGSLVAALGSWLDAQAHGGRWLLRIEDVDTQRCMPGADRLILQQLWACGLTPSEAPVWQSQRGPHYAQALAELQRKNVSYPCSCSRRDIAAAAGPQHRHAELIYPGTCRHGLHGKPARAWRLLSSGPKIDWWDRRLGPQSQDVEHEVGDFVLKRADGLWAYQLAVVVDDAIHGVSDVVRGQDLADNTPRQILLQRHLGLPTPRYLHLPLVLDVRGEKLSKQNGAPALDLSEPRIALKDAAHALNLDVTGDTVGEVLAMAVRQFKSRWATDATGAQQGA